MTFHFSSLAHKDQFQQFKLRSILQQWFWVFLKKHKKSRVVVFQKSKDQRFGWFFVKDNFLGSVLIFFFLGFLSLKRLARGHNSSLASLVSSFFHFFLDQGFFFKTRNDKMFDFWFVCLLGEKCSTFTHFRPMSQQKQICLRCYHWPK